MWSTLIINEEEGKKALACARGRYQNGLLRGLYGWQGEDFTGNASQFVWRYQKSRKHLVERMLDQKIKFTFINWKRGRLCVIGTDIGIYVDKETVKFFGKLLKDYDAHTAIGMTIAWQRQFREPQHSYKLSDSAKLEFTKRVRWHKSEFVPPPKKQAYESFNNL